MLLQCAKRQHKPQARTRNNFRVESTRTCHHLVFGDTHTNKQNIFPLPLRARLCTHQQERATSHVGVPGAGVLAIVGTSSYNCRKFVKEWTIVASNWQTHCLRVTCVFLVFPLLPRPTAERRQGERASLLAPSKLHHVDKLVSKTHLCAVDNWPLVAFLEIRGLWVRVRQRGAEECVSWACYAYHYFFFFTAYAPPPRAHVVMTPKN